MRRKVAAVICAAFVVVLSAGAASAGEVKGPPGTPSPPAPSPIPGTSGRTAAPEHANSACAFSGLNDERAALPVIFPRRGASIE